MNKFLLMVDDVGMALLGEILSNKIEFLQVQSVDSGLPDLKVMVMPVQSPLPCAQPKTAQSFETNPIQNTSPKVQSIEGDNADS